MFVVNLFSDRWFSGDVRLLTVCSLINRCQRLGEIHRFHPERGMQYVTQKPINTYQKKLIIVYDIII